MFSGIVQGTGKVVKPIAPESLTLHIQTETITACKIGDSISVSGVCLSVTHYNDKIFYFDVIPETLSRTNLGNLKMGDFVNIENSLGFGDKIGGHMVQGHVDTVGEIISLSEKLNSLELTLSLSKDYCAYLIPKGFITLDGMSITVIDIFQDTFTVALIPHTRQITIAQFYQAHSKINIEIDPMSKHIHHYLRNMPCLINP